MVLPSTWRWGDLTLWEVSNLESILKNWDWICNIFFFSSSLDTPSPDGQETICSPCRKYSQVPLPSLRESWPHHSLAEEWGGIQRGAPYWRNPSKSTDRLRWVSLSHTFSASLLSPSPLSWLGPQTPCRPDQVNSDLMPGMGIYLTGEELNEQVELITTEANRECDRTVSLLVSIFLSQFCSQKPPGPNKYLDPTTPLFCIS